MIPLFGAPFSRRFPGACGAGAVVLTLVMLLLTALGIPWSFPWMAIVLAICSVGWVLSRGSLHFSARRGPDDFATPASRADKGSLAPRHPPVIRRLAVLAILAAFTLVLYGTATARITSTDLLYFWGPKGQQFAASHAIDAAFLAEPDHFLMHPDYPPLLPCLFAWGGLAAGKFPWGAAMLNAPIFFALLLLAFRRGARATAVLASVIGFGFVAAEVGGNAEPPLLFFEALALGSLVLGDRREDLAASVALAGCVLSKFEGMIFAAAAIAVFVLLERRGARIRSLLRLAALPAAALGAWLAFCASHGILDNYAGGRHGPLTFVNLSKVAAGLSESAGYGVLGLPWLALAALAAFSRPGRRALAPAAVALVFAAVNASFYLHGDHDPSNWIAWSAPRTLLTPMLCLVFAATAGWTREAPAG